MKSLVSNLIVVALFVCLSVQYGSGLYCYECNDRLPERTSCKNVTSKMIKNCGNDFSCSIEWFRDKSPGQDITYVRRSCVNATMSGRHKVFFRTNHLTIMFCNTHICNSADGLTLTKVMLFTSALLSLLFFKIGY